MTNRNIFLFIEVFLSIFLISCNSGYQKEKNKWTWVSYDEAAGRRGRIIEKADMETFVVLENEKYAKDKNNVYFMGRTIEFAEPNTFEIINDNGYSKDSKNVYLELDIIINSDPKTFIILDWPYSKDGMNVFCGNLPLKISDPNGFEVTKIGSSRTVFLKSHFIEINSDYFWLDSINVNRIIIGEGEGKTQTEKFIGYKKK